MIQTVDINLGGVDYSMQIDSELYTIGLQSNGEDEYKNYAILGFEVEGVVVASVDTINRSCKVETCVNHDTVDNVIYILRDNVAIGDYGILLAREVFIPSACFSSVISLEIDNATFSALNKIGDTSAKEIAKINLVVSAGLVNIDSNISGGINDINLTITAGITNINNAASAGLNTLQNFVATNLWSDYYTKVQLDNIIANLGDGEFVTAITDYHNFEMGFDNVGLGVIEGEKAFQAIVVGDNNIYGESSFVWGYNNEALLPSSMSFVYGSFNKTYQNQIIFGGHNEFPNSTDITVLGTTNKGNEKSRTTLVVGCMNQIKAPCTYTIGYRITSEAKGARAIGRYFTIPNEPKNEQGFFLGDGDKDKGFISFAHRVNKSIANPLFGQTGEPQFIAERGIRTEYLGALKPVAKTININGTATANLDIESYGQFRLTGSGTANLQLSNWEDGDEALLIFNSTQIALQIPAEWVTLGADFSEPRIYAVQIAKFEGTVFYSIKYPNATGGGTGNIGDTLSIGSNGNWYIDNNDTGVKAQGEKGDPGTGTGGDLTEVNNNLATLRVDLTNVQSRINDNDNSFATDAIDALLPNYSRAIDFVVDSTGVKTSSIGWLVGAPGARTLTINDVQVARGLTPTLENAGAYVATTTSHAQIQILVQPSDVIKLNSSTLTFTFIPCKGVQ